MKTISRLSAAACLVAGLTMPAAAQNAEPDCPEDFDTLPGCDMSPMDDPNFPNNLRDAGATVDVETEAVEAETAPEPTEAAEAAPTPDPEPTEAAEAEPTPEPEPVEAAEAEPAPQPAEAEAEPAETAAAAEPKSSETHVVSARGVKFAPVVVFIEPGDTVAWENMPSHNIETIDEMVPDGQPKIKTELGEDYFSTFDTPGIVVYKCTPHWGARMGGILVVGTPDDPEAIIDAYMASTEVNKVNLPARGLLKQLRKALKEKGMM
ncbi:MAG: plastocyanin/azurin family copper-binding protein [Pseudomonadota bacterium]